MTQPVCECPHCGVSLRGKMIPEEWREMYTNAEVSDECLNGCGHAPHFTRIIAIYDQKTNRTTHWKCPDCGKQWERD